jgi:hypothetical protein
VRCVASFNLSDTSASGWTIVNPRDGHPRGRYRAPRTNRSPCHS